MNSPSNKPLAQWIHALGATFLIAAVSSSAAAPRPASEPANSLKGLGDGFNLKAGQQASSTRFGRTTSESDLFSSTSTTERRSQTQTSAVGTTAGGVNVTVGAAQDINLKGSSVIGEQNVTLAAGNNINIEAAQNTSTQSNFYETKESGLLSGGGPLSISIGNRQQSTDHKDQSTTAAASTIGAINGNVNITAGNTYQQTGSDLLSPKGDITVLAKDIKITEARETSQSATETKFKQSGLTISISNPLLSAAQGVQSMAQAAGNTNDTRMKALAAASSALTGYNTWSSLLNKDTGKMDPEKAMDITINVSLGTSKSQSNTTAQADTAKASSLSAGGNVNVTATGAGKESNLAVQGSSVTAGNSAALTADGQVSLLAATNTASQLSTNSNSSTSVGVSYSVMTQSIGFNASASKGQGKSDGQDTSYTNTQIAAGNTATIKSGADTNIKGAVVTANTIKADVGQQFGGSLNIESLQDTSSYTSKQSSVGGSISVGGGAVTGGSISASKSNIDSTFKSVNQQSGLKAGDGGFQVSVANNTDLKGGAITSTQKAVDDKANTFTTGGQLTTTDLQNEAEFKGTAVGGTIGVGSQLGSSGGGAGNTKGSAVSTTSAGISGIAGNTAVRTTDAEAGLKPIFNADKAQKDIDAQVKITTSFGQQASRAIGDYAGNKLKEAIANKDQAEIDKWKEGGSARVGLHTLVGLLTGNVSGAVGAGATQSVIPYIGEQTAKLDVPVELKQALIQVASGVIGAAVGGPGGAASGLNATSQNYLTTTDIRNRDQKIRGCQANGDTACEVRVLKEYDLLSAKNTAEINYKSVLSEVALKEEKSKLEQLLSDPKLSAESKAQTQRSINELDVAINGIQKSPVLKDAAQLGLVAADVLLLGELALARTLGSTLVRELVATRTGKEISELEAARITNNFYSEGAQFSSNVVNGRPLANLRLEYEQAARDLTTQSNRLLASGQTEEQVARWAVDQRNQLKIVYRDLTPPADVAAYEARNLINYGNKLGPNIEQLRAQGNSWQQIIEKSARPGGTGIDFSPLGFGHK